MALQCPDELNKALTGDFLPLEFLAVLLNGELLSSVLFSVLFIDCIYYLFSFTLWT